MGFLEIFIMGVGLSFDAMAAAISLGVCSGESMKLGEGLEISAFFGFFQALMPLIGYALGRSMASLLKSYDHWIALILLGLIGVNMLREGLAGLRHPEAPNCPVEGLSLQLLLLLSIATSIDALAAGLSLAFSDGLSILPAVLLIGLTTFTLSLAGAFLGKKFSQRFQYGSRVLGGLILIALGLKIFIEHVMKAI